MVQLVIDVGLFAVGAAVLLLLAPLALLLAIGAFYLSLGLGALALLGWCAWVLLQGGEEAVQMAILVLLLGPIPVMWLLAWWSERPDRARERA